MTGDTFRMADVSSGRQQPLTKCRWVDTSIENTPGSSLSPMYFMRHQLNSNCQRVYGVTNNLRRHVIRKRLNHLRISWRHRIPQMPSSSAGVFCMDLDSVEQRYLLCGSCNGDLFMVDFESSDSANFFEQPQHHMILNNTERAHNFMITCCQWYPQDTSLFATASVDKTVKLWDTNRMLPVDMYQFEEEIAQIHWSSEQDRQLIAVANMTSNIPIIDPRSGDALQHLRWKNEAATTVRWSSECPHILSSGGDRGNIVLWDVRSSKSYLSALEPQKRSRTAVSGIRFSKDGLHIVSVNTDLVVRVWRTHTLANVHTVTLPIQREQRRRGHPTLQFDTFSEDGMLRACIPIAEEVIVLNLEHDSSIHRYLLAGHFEAVNACLYREGYQQVISSSNDRMILVWSPDMDEILPESQQEAVAKLQKDEWSDEDCD